ncbi:MAG: dihydroneopterin aldolase [Rhodanobacteraceae bacterium]
MDIVFIEGLTVETIIGIYDWERRVRQPVVLDVEMGIDNSRAAMSDRIEDALNYKAVSKRLVAFIEASSFQLVEALAECCAQLIREEFAVPWVRIRLAKPGAVRGARAVGVVVERGAKE